MKSRREARNEKDMYQKMLGQTQKLETKGKHSKSGNHDAPKVEMGWHKTLIVISMVLICFSTFSQLKLWGYLGSILIVVAGVAIYRYKNF